MNSSVPNIENKEIQGLSTYFYPVVAGLEISVLETYSRLAKKGWDISMHVTDDLLSEKFKKIRYEKIRDVKVFRYNYFIYNYFPNIIKLNYKSSGIICFHDFSIFPDVAIFTYIYILKKLNLKKFKVIFNEHGMLARQAGSDSNFKMKIKRLLDSTLGILLINNVSDRVISVSYWNKKELIKLGVSSNLITVFHSGIENIAFSNISQMASNNLKKKIDRFGDYIVQLGRINRIKNLEASIKSLRYASSKLKLVIVGSDQDINYKKYLNELIKKLDLEERVIFYGTASGVEKYLILKKAVALIHLSKSEGYSVVVHEAMSQGCICIVSKGTSLEELIKDGINGYCINSSDYKNIGKKINQVYLKKDGPKIKKMKKNNITVTHNDSWDNVAFDIEKFYKNTLTAI